MSDLFGPTPAQPKRDDRDLICDTCRGPFAHCRIGNLKLCRRCVPADFWPANREGEA